MKKLNLLITLLFINVLSYAGILNDYRSVKRDVNTVSEISNHPGGVLIFILAITIIIIPLVVWSKIHSKKQTKIAKEKIDNYLITIKGTFKIENLNVENWADVESLAHTKGLDWLISKGEEALRNGRRLKTMIAKYGEDKGYKIYNKQFYLGMSKEELKDSTGEPTKIEIEVLKTKTKEVWIYGNKSSGDVFVFENEILTKFTDR